jgi:putative two-component system response regulator
VNEKMKKRKIMIVDDNPDLLYIIKKRLENQTNGYEVICAESGKECFKSLKKGKIPDLVLLDIMMPEMSGWDVLAKLRNNPTWNNIPVFFLTAKTDDTSKGLGILTSEGYVTKPFDMMYLEAMIFKFFNKKEG